MPRPQPEDYATRSEYTWARRQWKRRHGGSLLAVLAIAIVFGGLSGSQAVLLGLDALALVGWSYMRMRP